MRRTSQNRTEEPGRERRRRLLFLCAGLIASTSLLPCSPANAQFHSLVDEIVIAAVNTPTAPAQPDAADIAMGVRDAVAALNAHGGVLGKSLRVTVHADDCTAASGSSVATRIAMEGAAVVIGHVCSNSAIAAAPIYAKNALIMLTPGARHGKLTDARAGPTIFRMSPRDDSFGRETAALIATRFAGKRVALVHDKSLEARTLAETLSRELHALAMPPVHREAYTSGEREYNALVARLVAANIDLVIIPAQPIEARIIYTRWRELNSKAILIGSQILAVPELEPLARQAGDALILMQPPGSTTAHDMSALRQRAKAAVEAWAHAVKKSGTTGSMRVTEYLAADPIATSIGPIRFDRNGDANIQAFAPHVWRDQGWRHLAASP